MVEGPIVLDRLWKTRRCAPGQVLRGTT